MKRLLVLLLLICVMVFVAVPRLTVTQAQTFPAWAPNTAYSVGQQVTYQDSTHPNHLYKCQQAHTSIVTWEPPNAPALWIDEGPYSGGGATATNTTAPTKTNTPGTGPTATKTNTPTLAQQRPRLILHNRLQRRQHRAVAAVPARRPMSPAMCTQVV